MKIFLLIIKYIYNMNIITLDQRLELTIQVSAFGFRIITRIKNTMLLLATFFQI